jgi:hypothetical protein
MTQSGGWAGSARTVSVQTIYMMRAGVLTGELVHLPPEKNLRLHLPVFDGAFVKVLEDDAATGHLLFAGRFRS